MGNAMIIDVHVHTRLGPDPGGFQYLLDQAEALDVTLCVNSLSPKDGTGMPYDPTEDEVKRCNDWTAELAAAHPERIIPMWYLNPAHGDFACRELEQRVAAYSGLQGVKLWVAVRCNDPRLDPIMRLCATHKLPVLQHTWFKVTGNLPGESTPMDLRVLALRHPNVSFFWGHCGGDYEYGAKCARGLPNVFMDLGGGEAMSGYVDILAEHETADHIVFGSDAPGRSLVSQLAKVYGADLNDEEREKILYRNAQAIFARQEVTNGATS